MRHVDAPAQRLRLADAKHTEISAMLERLRIVKQLNAMGAPPTRGSNQVLWKLRHIASKYVPWRPVRALKALKIGLATRRVIERSKKPGTSPKDWFLGIDDETWFQMNMADRGKALADLLPKMPDPSLQVWFTGDSGDVTLRDGFGAYRLFKNCYEARIGPIGSCRGILDFGCGWGRIIRFFLKDVSSDILVGIDHSEEAIRACKETNRWCQFILTEPHPPTPLASNSFKLIYLYSVFSHLPEEMHWAMLKEFHRLLMPGGMLIATTCGRDFIEYCDSLRKDPKLQKLNWHKYLAAKAFRNKHEALSADDTGNFCFESHERQGRFSFCGEACIPKDYVQRRWPEILDVCDYTDDRETCAQNVIVVRKRN